MIQRIQTVYWLLAIVLVVLWFFLPYATIEAPVGTLSLSALGLEGGAASLYLFTGWGTIILGVLAVGLLLFSIFSYRRAAQQLRASILATILLVGILLFEGFYIYSATTTAEGIWHAKIAIGLPLVATFLSAMGFHGVRRDQAYIRRMDRLR